MNKMEFYNERLILVASYTRRGRLPGHGLCFWFAGEEWKRLFEAGKEKQHAGNRLPLNVFSCGRQRKKERFRPAKKFPSATARAAKATRPA